MRRLFCRGWCRGYEGAGRCDGVGIYLFTGGEQLFVGLWASVHTFILVLRCETSA
jgi:hypothetical protein